MRTQWLNHKSSDRLLVFFSGWGIDCRPFSHLAAHKCDVLFVDRYIDLDFGEIPSIISQYKHTVMVGWSMGVWIISRMMKERPVKADLILAINGTEFPVNSEYGIDPQWFKATMDQFDQQVLDKFYRRMCRDRNSLNTFLLNRPQRTLDSLKEELLFLYNECNNILLTSKKNVFSSALISKKDMIFQSENQTRAWMSAGVKAVEKNSSHFCFYEADCWEDVVAWIGNEDA